jgi:hypothetical protein
MMNHFESFLRTAIVASPVPSRHARRILDVLDWPPSPRRDRIIARMRNRTAAYLNQDEESIDWTTVQWALVILDVIKILLTIITLFGEEEMAKSIMQSCPPENRAPMSAALASVPPEHMESVQGILNSLLAFIPWAKLPALVPLILAEITAPSAANLNALFAAVFQAFTTP